MTNKSKTRPKPKGMSLFFKRVSQAVFKHGGWSTPKNECSPDMKQFVVFEGEYAGTWLFMRSWGKLKYNYSRRFALEDKASTKKKNYGFNFWKERLLERHLQYSHAISKLDWRFPPKTVDKVINKELSCMNRNCEDPYCLGVVWKKIETLRTEIGEKAIVFAARAGYDAVSLLQELNKNPGRMESLVEALSLDLKLSSHKDRVSFSKKFFQTWSTKKSLPAWVKRPQRWKAMIDVLEGKKDETPFVELNTLRFIPKNWTGVPGLKETGIVNLTAGFLSGRDLETLNSTFEFQFKSLGIAEKREFIKNLVDPREVFTQNRFVESNRYLDLFYDALRMWNVIQPEYYQLVDEDREWIPKLQKAIRMKRPYIFIQMHDCISNAANIVNLVANKDKVEKALNHHKNCLFSLGNTEYCSCPAEFKQLTTQEEFDKEGDDLNHCIAYYFLEHKSSYFMSMENKVTKERSSVMLSISQDYESVDEVEFRIIQHYGVRNAIPSKEDQKILEHHVEYCTSMRGYPYDN